MPTDFPAPFTGIPDNLYTFLARLLRSCYTYIIGGTAVNSRYLLIKRWQEDTPPKSIRLLPPGSVVRLKTGEQARVHHVGVGRVLLEDRGWIDWRLIDDRN